MSDDAFAARTRETPLEGVTSGTDRLHALPQIPDHELIRPIGRGSYGEVWLARSVMGTYRAVKIIYRHTFKDIHPFEREYNGIRKFEPISRSHEGLMDILQIGRNDQDGYFYYVMELADDANAERGTRNRPSPVLRTPCPIRWEREGGSVPSTRPRPSAARSADAGRFPSRNACS